MSKRKIYFILGRTVWTLALAGLVFLLFTGMKERQQTTCSSVLIHIASVNGKVFIDEKDVQQILQAQMGGPLLKKEIKSFNLRKMEARLRKEVWIRDAQLFFDNQGKLHANIIERVPVARVFDFQGMSYYLDTAATVLPLSATDRADVPVFTNMPVQTKRNKAAFENTCREVIGIAGAINADEFWTAQAAQVDLTEKGKYDLYPAIGFHTVDLGTADHVAEKLARLKVFYREILSKKPINSYSRLSVAYGNQVVAVRGDTSMPGADPAKAMQVFNQLVNQNKQEVNAAAIESAKGHGRIMPEAERSNRSRVVPAEKANNTMVPAPPAPAPVKDSNNQSKPKAVLPPKTSFN